MIPTATTPHLGQYYDETFYESQVAESLRSAQIYLGHLWKYFSPDAVLDVGCGRGSWLKACHELGSTTLFGLDGDWNRQELLLDKAINFRSIDLNKPFSLDRRVDLAMSLEVAEHLQPSSSSQFVQQMTNAADAVLFGAAYTAQGGTNHINEQPHTYWAKLFIERGYAPFDFFRPTFWDNDNVCFWYRQNTFLYLKRGSLPYERITSQGFSAMADISFMNCIHPKLYELKLTPRLRFRDHIEDLIPSFARSIRYRMGARNLG